MNGLAINDMEIQTELAQHLVTPLHLQRGRTDNQDATGAVADDQFLCHQTSFNGFAQTDIICDQQIRPGHLNGACHRVELILLQLNATAKRGLQRPDIRA